MRKAVFNLLIIFITINVFSNTNQSDNSQSSTTTTAEYTLTINSTNGSVLKLFNSEITDQELFEKGDSIKLITHPAVGYKFSHWTGDVTGNRIIADVVLSSNKTVTAVFEKWEPATGIPDPEFGVFETYRMYDKEANRNSELTYAQNTEGGYYTHYIDNTDPNATDSDNKYGTASKPRVSFPNSTNIPAGSVIEYHGTSYTIGYTVLKLTGTEAMPIFIRGASADNRVEITGSAFYLNSEYVIMENLKMNVTVRSYTEKQAHHISIRNFYSENLSAVSYDDDAFAYDIVFYSNYVNRDQFDPADGNFDEADGMGIGINKGTNRVWIIDNIITRAGGDAVGNGHAAKYTAMNYYVGRNIMYTCGENAIDIKEVDTVIVSENVMFNFYGWSSGSNGTAMVMHYGPTYSPKNVWVINNEIFDCSSSGIQVGGDQIYDVYIIGNLIHDIHNEFNSANAYISWSSQNVYMINNTFYNVDNGINSSIDNTNATLFAYNNIISKVGETGYQLSISGSDHMANSVFENNLFYQPDGLVQIKWGSNTYTLDQFIANTDKGAKCIEGDPLFVNQEKLDFTLQSDSPAIDAGMEHNNYQLYETLYGISIATDANGITKPNGDFWDIGAYEFDFSNRDSITNTDELTALIASSKIEIAAVTIGDAVGEYTNDVVNAANTAVTAAQASLANATTQTEIDQATSDLTAAMSLFVANTNPMAISNVLDEDFCMYPNPIINTLVLKNISNVNSISIINMAGRIIKSISNSENTIDIDVSHLNSGAYIVKLNTGNSVSTRTFIKQ
jgi:hypothetical protein